MPLTTLNVVLSKAYPMSVSPSIDFLLRWDPHHHRELWTLSLFQFYFQIFTLEFHTFTHCCFSFIGAMGLYMYMFGYVKQFNLHRFSKLRTLFSIIEIVLASILRCQDHQHDHNVCDVWHVKMSKITIVLVLRNNITYHMNTYLIVFDSNVYYQITFFSIFNIINHKYYIINYIIKLFCSIIVENCAVICMWGGDWWA